MTLKIASLNSLLDVAARVSRANLRECFAVQLLFWLAHRYPWRAVVVLVQGRGMRTGWGKASLGVPGGRRLNGVVRGPEAARRCRIRGPETHLILRCSVSASLGSPPSARMVANVNMFTNASATRTRRQPVPAPARRAIVGVSLGAFYRTTRSL